jgi:hypothetical protein
MDMNLRVINIAGPKGAGKTTFAREFLPKEAGLRYKPCPVPTNSTSTLPTPCV